MSRLASLALDAPVTQGYLLDRLADRFVLPASSRSQPESNKMDVLSGPIKMRLRESGSRVAKIAAALQRSRPDFPGASE